jgi:hypothetical protein
MSSAKGGRSVLQGIDLEKQFLVGDLWKSVLDDDEEMEPPFPRALLEAVVRRICIADEPQVPNKKLLLKINAL